MVLEHESLPYPVELNTLGDHVRRRRLDLGLTQRQMAERLGATASTIWNWEANHSPPQLRFIPRIIAFLGYDPDSTASGSPSDRIVAYRRSTGLSQKGQAHRLGIDPSTLGKWERGHGQPNKRLLAKVEDLLTKDVSSASGIEGAR